MATTTSVVLSFLLLCILANIAPVCSDVFNVKYRYAGRELSLVDLTTNDARRQLRLFSGVDASLIYSVRHEDADSSIEYFGRPDGVGIYFTTIGIGTPPKNYTVQVDTGSDIMWVNCIYCSDCPKRSSLGIDLTLYNMEDSLTGKYVSCDQEFCQSYDPKTDPISECTANTSCHYFEGYGDGSSTDGFFVEDVVQYDSVSGDFNTSSANGTIIFGCGVTQSGGLDSSEQALDGIIGFGKGNSSVISQLASSKKVKKMFAHCLDGKNGGGIFAIGHIVQPNVNTTPLIPNQTHYNINMTAVEVGHYFLNLPTDIFEEGDTKGTIIDSGTNLAYFPEVIYEQLLNKILSQQPDMELHIVDELYTCFQYSGSVNDGFPPVTFHFENSLTLEVLPRDYLFPMNGELCIGWQNSANLSRENKNLTLLGDLVLSNKLVVYDLENQVIGWTDYNCSSSIKVKDEQGTVHLVGSHHLQPSSTCSLNTERNIILLLLLITLLHRLLW